MVLVWEHSNSRGQHHSPQWKKFCCTDTGVVFGSEENAVSSVLCQRHVNVLHRSWRSLWRRDVFCTDLGVLYDGEMCSARTLVFSMTERYVFCTDLGVLYDIMISVLHRPWCSLWRKDMCYAQTLVFLWRSLLQNGKCSTQTLVLSMAARYVFCTDLGVLYDGKICALHRPWCSLWRKDMCSAQTLVFSMTERYVFCTDLNILYVIISVLHRSRCFVERTRMFCTVTCILYFRESIVLHK